MKARTVSEVAFLATAFLAFFGKTSGDEIDRIFKGWFLSPHEFPWMVKLKVRKN